MLNVKIEACLPVSKNFVITEINVVLATALECYTLDMFREIIKGIDFKHIHVGFGSNHSWVHEWNHETGRPKESRFLLITEN